MILHVDMDAFYASVELRDNPSLVGQPVVVGGSPRGRGVIAAASYEARKFGIHSAMPASQALRKCPQIVFIKPRMNHYAAVSKQIREIFFQYTSLVEPLSLDEAFLDVTGSERLFGDAVAIGKKIQAAINNDLGLVASVGVAPNKYLAKVASDLEKPNGFVCVANDSIEAFLAPLPIERIWGVGPKTAKRLLSLGVQTIGQLRGLPRQVLDDAFGINGEHFWRLARGLDTRPVVPDRVAKTVSHETTFSSDINDDEALSAWLLELTDQVARRMRRHEIFGKTVQLKVRFSDFRTITRAHTLPVKSHTTQVLWEAANELLTIVRRQQRDGVRLLGMGVSQLSNTPKRQQLLFDAAEEKRASRVDQAADEIRDKFGIGAVTRASSLQHRVKFRAEPRPQDRNTNP